MPREVEVETQSSRKPDLPGDKLPKGARTERAPTSDPVEASQNGDAEALTWLANYVRVPVKHLHTFPIQYEPGQVVFMFGNSIRKVRRISTGAWSWDRSDGEPTPALWPLPNGNTLKRVWLFEGESDTVVALHAGIEAYGLTHGTGSTLTAAQCSDLSRRGVEEVVLALDCDEAGQKALPRHVEAFRNAGLQVSICKVSECADVLRGEKDIRDVWVRMDADREGFRRVLEDAVAPATEVMQEEFQDGPNPIDLGCLPEPMPIGFVVEKMIPRGYATNLYAESGQGKSYLALHLAACVVTGTSFLGHDVTSGSVLYLDWELDQDIQRVRFGEVVQGVGLSKPPKGLYYFRMTESFSESFDRIKLWIERLSPSVTVIDSVGKALGDDPLDHRAIVQLYNRLDELGTTLCIDHQAKPGAVGGYDGKWEFGSSNKRNLARSSWQLERIGGSGDHLGLVLRHRKSNFGPLLPDIHAAMRFGEGAVFIEASNGIGEALGLHSEILNLLREERLTADELIETLDGYGESTVRNKLTELKRSGVIREDGKNGRAPVYTIAVSESEDGARCISEA